MRFKSFMRPAGSAFRGTLRKTAAAFAAFLLTAFNFGGIMSGIRDMPEVFYAENESDLGRKLPWYSSAISLETGNTLDETLGEKTVSYRLFGLIKVKTVKAFVSERAALVPGGMAVGISIHTDGVLIVGIGSFIGPNGYICFPARDAGLKAGDVILSVNESPVSSSFELSEALEAVSDECSLLVDRSGERFTVTVRPEVSDSGERRIGAWVRDSTVGIGTLTFFDPETGAAAALGHAVVDQDTGSLLKVKDGKLVEAQIIGVTRGVQGAPGELHGTFGDASFVIGTVERNTDLGVFGTISEDAAEVIAGRPMEIAFPDEVRIGEAELICAADGVPRSYSCSIVKTYKQDSAASKGLVIEITDGDLIELTGGIVQGMSGSPVIQDGRLVGVITHVLVNDPKKGYGAYAYWMLRYGGG